jgi:hypothetical protein
MKIFGQVLDTDNQPMSLANIVIVTEDKSNEIGEQADLDGNFVFDNEMINPDSEFKVSYIGYLPQIFKASELQGKKIKLQNEDEIIDNSVFELGTKGKPKNNTIKSLNSNKDKFVQYLQNHRFIYGGIGAVVGIFLIVRAFNNKK